MIRIGFLYHLDSGSTKATPFELFYPVTSLIYRNLTPHHVLRDKTYLTEYNNSLTC